MAAKTWDNGGGDGLWSTGANWSDDAVPATTDALTFDGTSVAACTIDNVGTWSNGTITITSAYTGSFTQNVAMSISGSISIGPSPAVVTWTQNANLSGNFTITIGATGTFTRTAGTTAAGISVNATGVLNLGTSATVNSITCTSGGTITGDGAITFVTGTTNLGDANWDTSGVTSLLCQGSGTAAHALTVGVGETALSGVPITVTGSGNFTFTGAAYDFNVVSIVKGGSGSIIVASTATIDLGASPTTTSNGMTLNGTVKVSGTWTFTALATASPVNLTVGSTGTVSGALTTINLNYGLNINAAATWPAGVVLNIDNDTNATMTITATAHTFGTCTFTGSGASHAFTIAAGTSLTFAANQTSTSTGTFTVTGTLNLLGNLTLGGAFTTSASSTLSGTGIVTATDGAWTMNATCTVSATVGVGVAFTSATGRTFAGASKTYASLTRTGAGSGTLTITGTNTFTGAVTDNEGLVAHTIIWPNVTTTVGGFAVKGSTGKLVTLSRTGGSGTWTLAKSTLGAVTSVDYISVSNSTVDASPIWYAGANSTDGTGNTNWIFTAPPVKNRKSAILL